MGIYQFEVDLKLPDGVSVDDAEAHIADAIACYAGSLPPEDLFTQLDRNAVLVRITKRPAANRMARWYVLNLDGRVWSGPFLTKKGSLSCLENEIKGIPRTRRLRRECYVITTERRDGSISESLFYVATLEGARAHEIEVKWPRKNVTKT